MFDTLFSSDLVANIAININQSLPGVRRLIFAGAYLVGLILMFLSIRQMIRVAAANGSYQQGTSIGTSIAMIAGSVALVALPTSLAVSTETFWGTTTGMGWIDVGNDPGADPVQRAQTVAKGVLALIQVVGLYFYVKGWVILKDVGTGNMTIGKPITHIVGGIAAFNIYDTVELILTTAFGETASRYITAIGG